MRRGMGPEGGRFVHGPAGRALAPGTLEPPAVAHYCCPPLFVDRTRDRPGRMIRNRRDRMSSYSLTHLKQLEAESIHIIREVAAEFRDPVMLYSIGKDSGVMVHLARKAFYPGRVPFPVLHVDTTWKFRDMIAFRDRVVPSLGVELIVYKNDEGLARGINPISSGSSLHTQVMKTEAL